MTRTATFGEARLELRRREYALLAHLAREPYRVFTRAELLSGVWGYQISTTRTVDSHASRLRRTLKRAGAGVCRSATRPPVSMTMRSWLKQCASFVRGERRGERPVEPLHSGRQRAAWRAGGGRPTAPLALLLAAVHNGDFESVACPQLIQEVREGLQKPYFRAKLNALEAMEAVERCRGVLGVVQPLLAGQAAHRHPTLFDQLVEQARDTRRKLP